VAEDLPIIDPMADLSPEVRPWQIQLDDGLVCGARTHGSTTFRETYQCVDPATGSEDEIQSTVSNVDTAASMWTIQQVNAPSLDAIPDRDNPPTRTAQVVTAWSTGSPRALHAVPPTFRAANDTDAGPVILNRQRSDERPTGRRRGAARAQDQHKVKGRFPREGKTKWRSPNMRNASSMK